MTDQQAYLAGARLPSLPLWQGRWEAQLEAIRGCVMPRRGSVPLQHITILCHNANVLLSNVHTNFEHS